MGKGIGQIIVGVIIVVVGGVILAWLVGDGRFSPQQTNPVSAVPIQEVVHRQETAAVSSENSGSSTQPVAVVESMPLPLASHTPYPTAITTPASPPPQPSSPEWRQFGSTVRGEALEVVRFGYGKNKVVLLGGLHAGFTPASVAIAESLVGYFTENLAEVPDTVSVYIIPSLNKDSRYDPGGWSGRANANDVDLNRNWDCDWKRDATWRGSKVDDSGGPEPFSEPETSALRDLFLQVDPDVVIIWGALFRDGLIAPGQCDRATDTTRTSYALAGVFGSASGYAISDYESAADQVINGDISNWLDKVGIPSFFVLLDGYEDIDWRNNLEGVRAILAYYAN